jgi:uncharacterized protein YecE (DUF72 family)
MAVATDPEQSSRRARTSEKASATIDAVSRYFIGISGWNYAGWRGDFYPPGLPHRRELEYASHRLPSIEINGSFYSLQRPSSYRTWYEQTPTGFVFSVKGPRFVTHMKKLSDVQTPLANFFASGVLLLREKLGPLLWQLPPMLGFDANRLASFFALLPRTTQQAAELSQQHDERMDGRAWTATDAIRPLRHALEVRHSSFETPAFIDVLTEYDVALVTADTAGRWPFLQDQTSDFAYARLHGDEELYVSGYSDEALDIWADRARAWGAGDRDVYVYFDNDVKVRAPYDAMSLARRLAG